jgi:hypothetical protein
MINDKIKKKSIKTTESTQVTQRTCDLRYEVGTT